MLFFIYYHAVAFIPSFFLACDYARLITLFSTLCINGIKPQPGTRNTLYGIAAAEHNDVDVLSV